MVSPDAAFLSTSFSADGRFFGSVSVTHAVSVVEVTSGSVVFTSSSSSNNQTTNKATCVAVADQLVAFGTQSGAVFVAALVAASKPLALPTSASTSSSSAAVAAIAFVSDSKVAAVSTNGIVSLFDTTSKSQVFTHKTTIKNPSALTFDAVSMSLAVAGTRVAVLKLNLDAKSCALVKEFTGHATQVSSLLLSDANTCVSAAKQDRFIAVWDIVKGANSSALTLESAPVSVVGLGKKVAAVTEDGLLALWDNVSSATAASAEPTPKKKKNSEKNSSSNSHQQTLTKPPVSTVSVKIVSVDSKTNQIDESVPSRPAPILAATFDSADSILFAYGSTLRPSFERVSVLQKDHSEDGTEGDDELVKGAIEIVRAMKGNTFVGVNELQAKQMMSKTKAYTESATSKLITSTTPLSLNLAAQSASSAATSQEPSLQDRLQTLNLSLADETATKRPFSGKRHDLLKTPTATSLHNLLTQSIHSGDTQLLEQCLQVSDPVVITATIKRLPAAQVVPLLNLLTVRLQMRPTRAKSLIEWIRAVVICHAAFLMTNPSLVSHLSTLHATLTTRSETFTKLLKLSGRLDLVTSQIALRQSRAQFSGDDEDDDVDGVVVYDEEMEGDDDDEDDDDEMDEDEDLDSDEFGEEEEEEEYAEDEEEEDPDFDEDADLDELGGDDDEEEED
ncbi:WD repeat-containing protein 43 [Rhizoclosmatium sp. JEL0117]|nr:WD repeat-containing protein 43 [Rhizoclosmatium sp. JEL0117]